MPISILYATIHHLNFFCLISIFPTKLAMFHTSQPVADKSVCNSLPIPSPLPGGEPAAVVTPPKASPPTAPVSRELRPCREAERWMINMSWYEESYSRYAVLRLCPAEAVRLHFATNMIVNMGSWVAYLWFSTLCVCETGPLETSAGVREEGGFKIGRWRVER